jgi:hypothetical protein
MIEFRHRFHILSRAPHRGGFHPAIAVTPRCA